MCVYRGDWVCAYIEEPGCVHNRGAWVCVYIEEIGCVHI